MYKLNSDKKSVPLVDLLEQISSSKLANRERKLGLQPYRMEEAIKPTKSNPFWLIDFSKRRYEGGPGKASKNTPVESFDMTGFQFAEETAVLYDPDTHYVVVQYNHHGPRAASIADYFSSYDSSSPNHYELLLQISPDAQARLQSKTIFTRIHLKVAPSKLSPEYKKNNVSLMSALSSQTDEFGGDTVTFEVSLNRGSNTSLKIKNKLKALLKMANQESDAVSAMVITGKDGVDSPIDAVDLIRERLETSIKDMPLDSGLRYPKDERYKALQRAYNGWKKDKIII